MHRLISVAWGAYEPYLMWHIGDLHWRLRPQPPRDPQRDIRLWFDRGGQLAGVAWFDPPRWGEIQCAAGADRAALEPELFG